MGDAAIPRLAGHHRAPAAPVIVAGALGARGGVVVGVILGLHILWVLWSWIQVCMSGAVEAL